MEVFGIGTDLVETSRIVAAFDEHGDRFRDRIFTPAEIAYSVDCGQPAERYAGRFAAKEAVSKAFGTGIGQHMSWTDIEVVHEEGGRPAIRLSGKAAAYAESVGVCQVMVSLSHTEAHASAYAVALIGE